MPELTIGPIGNDPKVHLDEIRGLFRLVVCASEDRFNGVVYIGPKRVHTLTGTGPTSVADQLRRWVGEERARRRSAWIDGVPGPFQFEDSLRALALGRAATINMVLRSHLRLVTATMDELADLSRKKADDIHRLYISLGCSLVEFLEFAPTRPGLGALEQPIASFAVDGESGDPKSRRWTLRPQARLGFQAVLGPISGERVDLRNG